MSKKFELPISLEELKNEYEGGLNTVQLSNKYGCSDVTIGKLLASVRCDRTYQGRKLVLSLTNEEMKSEYLNGATVDSLADKCGCTRRTILKRLDKVDCKRRDRTECTKTDLPLLNLKEDYMSGMTTIDLAEKYNSSKDTIARRLREIRCIRDTKGINNGRWKGGLSFEPYCQKFNEAFKESVREKFGRVCFLCPKTEVENGNKLSVHHVNYDKDCLCNDSKCEFVPLCMSCHGKTNKNREYWEAEIMKRIESFI